MHTFLYLLSFITITMLNCCSPSVIIFRDSESSELKRFPFRNIPLEEDLLFDNNIHFPDKYAEQQERSPRSSVLFDDEDDQDGLSKTNMPSSSQPSSGPSITFVEGEHKDMRFDQMRIQLCGETYGKNRKYSYDPKTKSCYIVGTKGPCGQHMIFYQDLTNEAHGVCDCITHDPRTFIYHGPTQQCYPALTQAYCNSGEWITLDSTGQPKCEVNPCHEIQQQNTRKEFVSFNSRCVQLNTIQPECTKKRQVVTFIPTQIQPACGIPEAPKDYALGSLKQPCRPGTFRSRTGSCQKGWKW